MFKEMEDPAERFVWFGILLLAGDSPYDGRIAVTEEVGYTDQQVAFMLKCPLKTYLSAKEKMIKHEKDYILHFADIWYSEATREKLKKIKIHS